jgi:hypothetical protein
MSSITLAPNASGTAVFTVAAPGTSTNRVLTLPDATTTLVGTDATQTLTNKTIQGGALTLGTAQATTSGTSIDFTSIPSWVKRITVSFDQVTTNGGSGFLVRLGDGSVSSTGYTSTGMALSGSNTSSAVSDSTGFVIGAPAAVNYFLGHMVLTLITGNTWVSSHTGTVDTTNGRFGSGRKSLTGTLDRVRITTVNGTDTFDGGTINIMYEG